jgi:hypothetical protein
VDTFLRTERASPAQVDALTVKKPTLMNQDIESGEIVDFRLQIAEKN